MIGCGLWLPQAMGVPMSTRNKILLLLGFVIVGALWFALIDLSPEISERRPPSTFSALPNGYKALFELLKELDVPVTRFLRPLSRLHATHGTLIVMDPQAIPFSPREIRLLKKWIRSGNTLIVFRGSSKSYASLNLTVKRKGDPKKSVAALDSSLAEELGLKLNGSHGEARKAVKVSSSRLYGVQSLSVSTKGRWKSPKDRWTTMVKDKAGPIILVKKMGKGEVIAVSDSSLVANGTMSLEQNVRLVPALLLEKGRPQRVLFDEYHHGYAAAESFWHYLGSSVFGWILLQVFLGCVLYFSSQRASFAGRFRTLTQPTGRSSLEYLDSMANVFESANAGTLALEAMLRRFLNQASRRTGIPLKRLEKEIGENRGLPAGEDLKTYALIRECRAVVNSGAETAKKVALARRLAKARARLSGRTRQ